MKKVIIVGSFPMPQRAGRPLNEEEFELELADNADLRVDFEQFQASCRELGKKLAHKEVTIFVGSSRRIDADLYVVEGANEVEGKHEVVVYTPHNWPYPAFIEQSSRLNNIDVAYWRVPGPWQNATAHIIRKVDAVIVIGGGRATLQAGMSAPALGKPVIALTAFNGAAEDIFAAFRGNYAESGMSHDHYAALQVPFASSDEVDKIVLATERFVEKRPFKVDTRLRVRVAVLVLVIGLIVAWGAVLKSGAKQPTAPEAKEPDKRQRDAERVDRDDPNAEPIVLNQARAVNAVGENPGSDKLDEGRDPALRPNIVKADADGGGAPNAESDGANDDPLNPQQAGDKPSAAEQAKPQSSQSAEKPKLAQDIGDSTGPLIAILAISAVLGSSLRAGFRLLQDQVVTWGDIANELIVGLLLSFSLLILYLAAGVLYEGDVLETTPANFRRLAVTVSAFALASAFLLENAASEVRRRFGQTLQK